MIEVDLQLTFPSRAFHLELSLSLPGKGVTGIFGPSGSGKTTLLRCIAGLERAEGSVKINDSIWQDASRFVPAYQRDAGYVFQESSLFEHLTARKNLDFAVRRTNTTVTDSDISHIETLLDIGHLQDQFPAALSGGERQRVAIARALLIRPRLLLMDEPLASLDVARRNEILPYLERVTDEFDMPVLYVSHAIEEISRLADHLVMINEGAVTAAGNLTEVLSSLDLTLPAGEEAGVVLKGRIEERAPQWHLMRIALAGGDVWVRDHDEPQQHDIRVRILARDVSITRSHHDDTSIQNKLRVRISEILDDVDTAMALIRLQSGDDFLIARLTRRAVSDLQLKVGDEVWAQIKTAAIV